jgi:hypothetical protein
MEEHDIGNRPYGGGLHPLTLRKGSADSLFMRTHWSNRSLRLVQGLRYLHPPYIDKFDDCDWLESLLIMDSSYPLRGK